MAKRPSQQPVQPRLRCEQQQKEKKKGLNGLENSLGFSKQNCLLSFIIFFKSDQIFQSSELGSGAVIQCNR
jgi:hypothetical protein